jgi:hypothetical protein
MTPNTQVSPQVQEAVRIAKEQREKAQLIAKVKHEDARNKRHANLQKFSLRIKNGIERTVSWYESEWATVCYDGIVAGSAVSLFGALFATITSSATFMSMALAMGGLTAAVPVAIAIVYWLIKGLIDMGKATVKGITNAAKHAPAVKLAMEEKAKNVLNPPNQQTAGAEATA